MAEFASRPFTGAWIETWMPRYCPRWEGVAPSRGRGLKPYHHADQIAFRVSPLHGGVD